MTVALAIDLGTVRVGVAVTDESGTIAMPLITLPRGKGKSLHDAIVGLVAQRAVSRVIVGLPRRLDGSDGANAADARSFAAELEAALSVPVELWDERFTTAEAERSLIASGVRRRERRSTVDQVAATLLLQGWMQADRLRTARGH